MNFKRIVLIAALAAAPLAASAESPQMLLVTKLYKEYAWEVVFRDPSEKLVRLNQEPRGKLEAFFSRPLSALIAADNACAKLEGVCKLDFAILWDSQDPSAVDLEISEGLAANSVEVKYRVPGTKDAVSIQFDTVREAGGWRISDMRYRSGTRLLKLLQ